VDLHETAIVVGGILSLGVAVFHVLFWRLFDWKEQLPKLARVNRGAVQAMNVTLIVVFSALGALSLAYTDELLTTDLGTAVLAAAAIMWAVRTALQPLYFPMNHAGSIALIVVFSLLAICYATPLVVAA
jgi:hypothetical protein